MALTQNQLLALAQYAGKQLFASATANFSIDDIRAAAQAIDNAFDTTLSSAVTAVGGSTTVINGLAAVIPAPFNTATVQQKTFVACWVLMKRAGLI